MNTRTVEKKWPLQEWTIRLEEVAEKINKAAGSLGARFARVLSKEHVGPECSKDCTEKDQQICEAADNLRRLTRSLEGTLSFLNGLIGRCEV